MSYALLKKACTRCRESSVRTYWGNIRSLARLAGHDDVPSGGRWVSDKLLARIKAEPLQRFKRFASAGVKAAQMYKVERPKWSQAMSESTTRYAKIRESGQRTKREHENWPKGGYQALGKLAKTLHGEVRHLEQKKKWSPADLYHYQKFLIVLFYSKHALRGDLADVRHKRPYGPNYVQPSGSTYTLHIGHHKTSKAHGAIALDLGSEMKQALDVFLPQVRRIHKHGFLLSTLRTGNRLTRPDMLRLIRNTTTERLGKNIGVQIIRVLKVTESAAKIDAATQLQREMGHGSGMQKKYISRT